MTVNLSKQQIQQLSEHNLHRVCGTSHKCQMKIYACKLHATAIINFNYTAKNKCVHMYVYVCVCVFLEFAI